MKHEPLSVTTVLGRPNLANMVHNCSIVAVDVTDAIGTTSSLLEWASTRTRNIFFAVVPQSQGADVTMDVLTTSKGETGLGLDIPFGTQNNP